MLDQELYSGDLDKQIEAGSYEGWTGGTGTERTSTVPADEDDANALALSTKLERHKTGSNSKQRKTRRLRHTAHRTDVKRCQN